MINCVEYLLCLGLSTLLILIINFYSSTTRLVFRAPCKWPQPAPLPGGMGKKYIRKIVQFRALLCSFDLAIFCGRW